MCRFLALISVLGLAACGDDDPVRHLDGGADSPGVDIDAPTGQAVTLTITYGPTAQAGVRVYFQNADSSLIASVVTDASGVASAVMPNGGYVTAINAFGGAIPSGGPDNDLFIYAGVKPGDHLSLTNHSRGTHNIRIDGAVDTTAGVVSYDVSSPCGGASVGSGSAAPPTWRVDVRDPCTTTDFLVSSRNDANEVVHWAYAPNTAVSAPTDLTGAALSNAPTTKTYALNNADAFEGVMSLRQSLASQRGEVVSFITAAFDPDLNELLAASLPLPSFANAIDIVDASGTINVDNEHHLLDWGPFATSYTTDVGARTLASISSPQIDTTLHQLTWTEDVPGVAAELVTAWGDASRSGPTSFNWRFWIAAPAGTPVQLPVIPADVADYNIGASDSYTIYGVNLGKVPGGYDAVRAHIFDLAFAAWNGAPPTTVVTSATGSAAFNLWAPRGRAARTLPKPRVLTGRTR